MPVITKPIEVPTIDQDENPTMMTVVIRKLSYHQVHKAKRVFFSEAIAQGKELGDLQEKIIEARKKAQEELDKKALETGAPLPPKPEEDPASFYDEQTTLHYGIVSWEYPEAVTNDNIDQLLGPKEADFIFREIVRFTERSAAERKDSGAQSPRTSEPVEALGQESSIT